MTVESPAATINDLNASYPAAGDPRSEGDDHIRNIKTAIKAAFPELSGRSWRSQSKSANYTALGTDNMSIISSTATMTLALTAAATLGNGWMILVQSTSGNLTIDPNAAETINGAATFQVAGGAIGIVFCTGTAFFYANLKNKAPTEQVLTSGTAATYTTPHGCSRLEIEAIGAGGGGAGGADSTYNGGAGGAGGATLFNAIGAAGGSGGVVGGIDGGAGGTAGAGTANFREAGAPGGSGSSRIVSGTNITGHAGPGGGPGGGKSANGSSTAGLANTGGGGSGGGHGSIAFANSMVPGGGGAGERIQLIINSPAATYLYTIPAGGTAGAAGTGGIAGAAGGSGVIRVREFYD